MMLVLPLDEYHAIIINAGETYFYSSPLESIFVHVPGEYPTLEALEREYKLPKFDEIITTEPKHKMIYQSEILEIGTTLYSDPLPPGILPEDIDDDKIYIGIIKFPLEHQVCDSFGDGMKVPFGSVSIYVDPMNQEFFISFAPDAVGKEGLYSLLYYGLTKKTIFEEILELSTRVLEWSNPIAYNKELEEHYFQTIKKRLEKITPHFAPLDYIPIYFNKGKIFVEKPIKGIQINYERIEMLKTILQML